MENASKALLIAGGVLIGILVLGALVLMVNQLGSYQRQNFSSEAERQVAQFNQDFTRFTDQDIKGVDIITLVNKVIDHNERSGSVNSLNYDIKITLTLNNLDGFAQKYGTNNVSKMFGKIKIITINQANGNLNKLSEMINNYAGLESEYGADKLRKLSSNFDSVYINKTKTIEEVIGVYDVIFDGPSGREAVEMYREYSEFKTSVFRSNGSPTYTNGQISGLSFKFVK